MRRLIFTLLLGLQTSNVHAGGCYIYREPTSARDWVIQNVCHFKNTVLVEIEGGYLREWYNPITHFRTPNTFKYEVKIIEVFRGQSPRTSCMIESTEATFVIRARISNTQQIVSFDENGECVVIDVGARQKATPELIQVAREVASSMKRKTHGGNAATTRHR